MYYHNAHWSVCTRCGRLAPESPNSLCPECLADYHWARKTLWRGMPEAERITLCEERDRRKLEGLRNRMCPICREKLRGRKRYEWEVDGKKVEVCVYCYATLFRIEQMPAEDQKLIALVIAGMVSKMPEMDLERINTMSKEEFDSVVNAQAEWRKEQEEKNKILAKRNGVDV